MPYVGTVVDGILNSGTIKTGDAVLIGPDANGNFQSTVVKSIQRKRYGSVLNNVAAPTDPAQGPGN